MLLEQLRTKLGDYQICDDDFYASDEVAEVESEEMYGYFTGSLSDEGRSRIDGFIEGSRLFLNDMIGIGEIVLARTAEVQPEITSWHSIRDLHRRPLKPNLRGPAAIQRDGLAFSLSSVHLAAADSSANQSHSQTLPSGVDVEVFEDGNNVVIDLSTRDTTLDGQLFGYSLRGEDQPILGIVMLHKGSSGVVSANAEVERSRLAGQYVLNVLPVGPADLGNEDAEPIVAAIERDFQDGISPQAWKSWYEQLTDSDDARGLAKLLQSVNDVLAR